MAAPQVCGRRVEARSIGAMLAERLLHCIVHLENDAFRAKLAVVLFVLAAGIGEAAANPAAHTRPSDPKASDSNTQNRDSSLDLVGVGVGCDRVEDEKCPPKDSNLRPAD
jgi:hypothetical protein